MPGAEGVPRRVFVARPRAGLRSCCVLKGGKGGREGGREGGIMGRLASLEPAHLRTYIHKDKDSMALHTHTIVRRRERGREGGREGGHEQE